MTVPPSLLQLLRFLDDLHEHVERTWWGAVVADSRFPLVWDANYAAVDVAAPDLTLPEVQSVLLPALAVAGASHEHLWIMDPASTGRLIRDLVQGGRQVAWDSLMVRTGGPVVKPEHTVRRVPHDDRFWERERLGLRAFGITRPPEVDQILRRHREVLLPAGKRWFEAFVDGEPAGIGSVLVVGDAAYVDDVVTFPRFRRRGVARSVMAEMLEAAAEAGARATYLFADQPGPLNLYEGLGFEVVERVVTSLAPLAGVQEGAARPARSVPSPRSAPSARPVRSTGSDPGRPR